MSGAYALDAVTTDEAAAVEAAMRSSEELRGEIAELTDTAVVLGLSVRPETPPPALRARLLDLIDSIPQLPAEATVPDADVEPLAEAAAVPAAERLSEGAHVARGRRMRQRRSVLILAVAAVAALVFGGGLLVDRAMQPPSESAYVQVTSASDAQPYEAAVAGGGTAMVYSSRSVGESVLVLNGVSRPAGRSLQMWVVTGGKPVSAGLFDPATGEHYEVIKGALRPGQVVAVTVEKPGGSDHPTTKPIVAIRAA